MKESKILLGSLCAIGCETLYGLSYIFTKRASGEVSTFALLGWRFLIAALAMSLCVALRLIKTNLRGKTLKPLLPLALLFPCIYFIGETVGIAKTTASESGVFISTVPVISLVASAVFLKKKPARLQVFGIAVTLIGVCVTVISVGVSSSFSIVGYAFLALAILSYIFYSILVEKSTAYTSGEITYVMLLIGALFYFVIAVGEALVNGTLMELVRLPFTNQSFLITVLYQGIACSVFAFFLANIALTTIGVNRTATFIGVSTVVSILAGVLWLHEAFTAFQVCGAGIIIAGIYIANAGKAIERKEHSAV